MPAAYVQGGSGSPFYPFIRKVRPYMTCTGFIACALNAHTPVKSLFFWSNHKIGSQTTIQMFSKSNPFSFFVKYIFSESYRPFKYLLYPICCTLYRYNIHYLLFFDVISVTFSLLTLRSVLPFNDKTREWFPSVMCPSPIFNALVR